MASLHACFQLQKHTGSCHRHGTVDKKQIHKRLVSIFGSMGNAMKSCSPTLNYRHDLFAIVSNLCLEGL